MALAIGMLGITLLLCWRIYTASRGREKNQGQLSNREPARYGYSIFASTLTTIIVFMPFIFSSNFLVKMMGKNIGVSIVSTLVISLMVALFFIPMATYFLLTRTSGSDSAIFKKLSIHNRMIQAYHLVLKASMRKPASTIIGTLIIFFTALLVSLTLSLNNPQEIQTPNFRLSVTMPGGYSTPKKLMQLLPTSNRDSLQFLKRRIL